MVFEHITLVHVRDILEGKKWKRFWRKLDDILEEYNTKALKPNLLNKLPGRLDMLEMLLKHGSRLLWLNLFLIHETKWLFFRLLFFHNITLRVLVNVTRHHLHINKVIILNILFFSGSKRLLVILNFC